MTAFDSEVFVSAGLLEPNAPQAQNIQGLLSFLLSLGWSPQEIVDNFSASDLTDLAPRYEIEAPPEFNLEEAAALLGVDADDLTMLRRSAGLAERGVDGPGFSASDIEAFRGLEDGRRMFTEHEANHFANVLGASLARIADASVSLFLIDIEAPMRAAGASEMDNAISALKANEAVNSMSLMLAPLFRMHLQDAIQRSQRSRELEDSPYTVRMAVGFVDLVGFTAFSDSVTVAEIADLVRTFEATAFDVVNESGGRVVKLIGDEVMFVADDVEAACTVAAELIGRFRGHDVAPRGGLAYGTLLAHGGDFYGPIVNLASRIGDLAVESELLVTSEIAERCPSREFEPAGRRQLKGLAEPVALQALSFRDEMSRRARSS